MATICLLVTGLGSGAGQLGFSTDYRIFFSPDDPLLKTLNSLHNTYTKDDNVLFVLTPRDGKVFSRKTLASIAWLTEQAWRVPYVQRVDSLQNFQYTYAQGDELVVRDLYRDPHRLSESDLQRLRTIALKEPLLRNRLISPDADVTGVNVSVLLPEVDKEREVPEVAGYVRRLARELESRDPNLEVRLTGGVMMSHAFPEASKHDLRTLVPAMFVLVFVVMFLLLRSVAATLWAFLTIMFAIASTMGLAGWLGFTLSPPSAAAPNIILTVAVADCIHVLVSFLLTLREGWLSPGGWLGMRRDATRKSLRINLTPVFLTSLTTAMGFLTLNFSDSPPFRDLGNIAAMGVGFAFLYTLLFLPALMLALPLQIPLAKGGGRSGMRLLAEFVIARWRLLLPAMSGLAILLAFFLPGNQLDDDLIKYFSEDTPFRQDTEYATRHLTGMYLMEYSLRARGPGGISDPAYLRVLDRFAQWYRRQPEVIHVYSIADILKRLNRNMHGDDPYWYKIPASRKLAAQYLLLYEMSLPEGLELNDRINVDKSASRFTVTLTNLSSKGMLALERRASAWLERNAPPYMRARATGPNLIFAHIGQNNIHSMVRGTVLAFLVISLVLIAALRSPGVGLLSLLPNVVPAVMAFGLWGIMDGHVNMGLSVVAGMTLGIVVDDTVHFLSKWLHARRDLGYGPEKAIGYAFAEVGTAMWITSLVLVVGFGALVLSDFQINAQMGLLTAITIAFALLADLFLLPPLLLLKGGTSAPRHQDGGGA